MSAGKRVRQRFQGIGERTQDRQVSLLDQLSEFEDFKNNILPNIQADLKSGLTAEQLRQKYAPLVQAALITTALIDGDASKRIAAAKDTMDRAEGKAKDRAEVTHRLEKLPDEQLDSLILSELEGIDLGEDETSRH